MHYNELMVYYSEQGLKQLFAQTNQRNYLWQIALPKSGSTWLSNIMSTIYQNEGWAVGQLVPNYGRRNQEIDPRYFFLYGTPTSNVFFVQQHCVYSSYTHYLIEQSRTKCILQVRNLFDVTVSVYDHLRKSSKSGDVDAIVLPQGVRELNDEMFMDYVISVEMPWYLKFVEGWYNSSLMKGGRLHKVSYEDLVGDVKSTVEGIIDFSGVKVSKASINAAIKKSGTANTRRNKAKIGRGCEILTDKQVEQILRMGKYCGLESNFELFTT